MFRWAGRARVVLIMLVLPAAIVVPVVVSGYADLRKAEKAEIAKYYATSAQYYVLAVRKLPWRTDLLEPTAIAMGRVNTKAAIPLFNIAEKHEVLSADGWILYGLCYKINGQYQAAWDTWTEGLKHYPKETTFYAYLALEDKRKGDFAAEAQNLSIWIASGKAYDSDYYRLGELLMTSAPDRAYVELKRAVSINDSYADAVQTLDASLALAALESKPSRRLVVIGRGIGLVNDWPLAQYDFQQAVNADPQNAEAWAWLGEAQQQNKQEGKVALDKALELDSNSSLVHGLRGLYWKRQGKPKAALAEYQAAAKLEPKNPEWQVALGDAYASTGDLVQALAAYVTATDLAPDNATYWRLLALFCADSGVQVLDVGLPAAKKAAEIAPNDSQVLDALGWTYSQAGMLNTAEQMLNKAIKAAPESASAHLHLAETYLREGQGSFAQSELNRVQQLDPSGPYGTFAAQLLTQYFP